MEKSISGAHISVEVLSNMIESIISLEVVLKGSVQAKTKAIQPPIRSSGV